MICGTPLFAKGAILSTKETLRAELAKLPLPERVRRIEGKLAEATGALAARNEKLRELRVDFAALSLDFWRAFAGSLGCENPEQTIKTEQAKFRSVGYLGTMAGIVALTVYLVVLAHGEYPATVAVCLPGIVGLATMVLTPLNRIARAREVVVVLTRQEASFWLTGGRIALSNLGVSPPAGAQWWWKERFVFVFVRHVAVRFAIDALKYEPVWEEDSFVPAGLVLQARGASEILRHLITTTPRYRQLVNSFQTLAALDIDYKDLLSLRAEAEQGLAAERERAALLRERSEQQATEAPRARSDPQEGVHKQTNGKASWETLIISQSLRENLQAYCRILRDYQAYRDQGVHLPKGLLCYGPPGCGKTQIAKTLSHEAGLNFVSLSTSDCKAMFIGWSADRLAKVFIKAREKQPSLIFIDELDAVCPPRGAYHDCISQEFTAQLLQEIDGLLSDSQAIFLVGATNRPDQVDTAILSRFAEQIEIPLPDAATRTALLELFLGSLRFNGNKTQLIRRLASDSAGQSGRDLRALVNQAVLSAVKRTASPEDFALFEADFATHLAG